MNYTDVKKRWSLRSNEYSETLVDTVIDKYKLSRPAAQLICARSGNSEEGVRSFINKDNCEPHDPFLLKDMDKAVARILRAVENPDEVVAIYGDYDVDGVTSVSMMYLYLTSLGLRAGYYIPSRSDEGYGINRAAIKKLHNRGVTLIITVDTGITAIDEVEYAASLGIDMIVTDHHECRPELPDAIAVMDPHRQDDCYPFKELAGVGVAFKLVCAVETAIGKEHGVTEFEAQRKALLTYGDLVSLGTVADVMPIINENRTIVSVGLKIIEVRPRPGIAALMEAAAGKTSSVGQKREITATYIGFTLAPRINAAGRMSNAAIAVELLLADNPENAKIIAEELCETNRLRQSEENKIADGALEKIEEEWNTHIKDGGVIVLADNEWQQGVIGIVASRVTERYGMPSILITFDGSIPNFCDESPVDLGKGSGRSVEGFNLVTALSECSDLLEKYGGHELAAGLSIRRGNLDAFREKLNEYARPILRNLERVQVLEADMVLSASDLTLSFAEQINSIIEPCGPQNPTPTFILNDVVVTAVRGIGAGKHLKFTFEKEGHKFTGLLFGVPESQNCFTAGNVVDVMFTVGINHYNGRTELQLILSDIRFAEEVYNLRINERSRLKSVLSGESFGREEQFLPERQDFVVLYRMLLQSLTDVRLSLADTSAVKLLSQKLSVSELTCFVKYRIMLEVFNELDIFKVEYLPLVSDEIADRWNLPEEIAVITRGTAEKVNLDDSVILKKLREQIRD
jgi:single-stranded-DNA-specific exonuclease